MAVPKRKTSKSKKKTRRSHHGIKVNMSNIMVDKTTGSYHLRHRMNLEDNIYNGRKFVEDNDEYEDDE